jgi:dienelactone hydrolase
MKIIPTILALFYLTVSAHAEMTRVEELTFYTNPGVSINPVKLIATLYIPKSDKPVPAMVIISSSGGVMDHVEGYYLRVLAQSGTAALVVDSFKPRHVSTIEEDQSLVTSWMMENDAFAALSELRKDNRIDPTKIGIMGVSKGGIVAQNSAMLLRRLSRRTGALMFALHVPIVPDCVTQQFRDATSTGRPIFYMLAELDDYTPAKPCVEYAERIKEAGNQNVETKVYSGQHHGWQFIGPVIYKRRAENYSACAATVEDSGDYTIKATNKLVDRRQISDWMKRNCVVHGAHVGGGTEKHKRQSTADLISFLKRNGF